jgi:hypothetical protein
MPVQIPFIGGLALGDSYYYGRLRQVSTRYFFDYVGGAFSAGTTSANSKIPLIQDTFAEHTTYYATPAMSNLGDAGDCEFTVHRASDGIIVAAPLSLYIIGSAKSLLPVQLRSDGLDLLVATPTAGAPTTFRQKLLWLCHRFLRAEMSSTQLIVKDSGGTTLTTQALTDNGSLQTMGYPT